MNLSQSGTRLDMLLWKEEKKNCFIIAPYLEKQ